MSNKMPGRGSASVQSVRIYQSKGGKKEKPPKKKELVTPTHSLGKVYPELKTAH